MIEKEYLSTDDIARIFGVSLGTLRRKKWRAKTGIPLKKVGKKLCGSRVAIEEWFGKLNG